MEKHQGGDEEEARKPSEAAGSNDIRQQKLENIKFATVEPE